MRKARLGIAAVAMLAAFAAAAEIHVAVDGKDANPGTAAAPLRTIQRAAELARPGDVVTVHAGVYRERVNPVRGGTSDAGRIVFRAAPGDPEAHRGLIVRVAGYSDYFCDLSETLQEEIISRTEHSGP